MHANLTDNGYRQQAMNVTSTGQLIRLPNGDRVDAILVIEIVFNCSLKERGWRIGDYSVVLEKDSPLGVCFTKAFLDKNGGFLNRFNSALKKFRKQECGPLRSGVA